MLIILVQWTLHTNQNHLLHRHLGARLVNDAKWTFLPSFLDSSITSFMFLTFVSCHAGIFSNLPIILPLLPLHQEFSLLEASEWICEHDCNDSENSSFFQWSDLGDVCALLLLALVSHGTNNTGIFCLAFPNIAVGFTTALDRYFARHCCWYRNFQRSTSGFHCELEFFVDSPIFVLLSFSLHRIWSYIVRSWGCLFPRRPFVQYNESCETCSCIWQFSIFIYVPVIFNMLFQQHIQRRMCCFG